MPDEGHPYAKLRPMWFTEHEPTDFTRDGGPDILRQHPMSMTDDTSPTPIPPALTPEQWHIVKLHDAGKMIGLTHRAEWPLGDMLDESEEPEQDRHALAAIALHGQPWGFSRADVRLVNRAAAGDFINDEQVERLHSLADRLAALLPPEGT